MGNQIELFIPSSTSCEIMLADLRLEFYSISSYLILFRNSKTADRFIQKLACWSRESFSPLLHKSFLAFHLHPAIKVRPYHLFLTWSTWFFLPEIQWNLFVLQSGQMKEIYLLSPQVFLAHLLFPPCCQESQTLTVQSSIYNSIPCNFRILYRIDEADPTRANFVYEKTFAYSAMAGKCAHRYLTTTPTLAFIGWFTYIRYWVAFTLLLIRDKINKKAREQTRPSHLPDRSCVTWMAH